MASAPQSGAGENPTQTEINHLPISPPAQPIEMANLEEKGTVVVSQEAGLNDTSNLATSTSTFPTTTDSSPSNDKNVQPAGPANPVIASSTSSPQDPLSSSTNAPVASTSIATEPPESLPQAPPSLITRADSAAIGPDTMSTPVLANDAGPVLVITLLLTSGARHPYKIDDKYLTKRGVNVPGITESGKKDPFSISVYTLKELILREWREEWEPQPSSPSSIRLIYFGRLLDDKTALKECKFNADAANVIHMTVRPQDVVDEEDASKSKALATRDREGGESTAGCRCVIL